MRQKLNSIKDIDVKLEKLYDRVLAFQNGQDDRRPIHSELVAFIRGARSRINCQTFLPIELLGYRLKPLHPMRKKALKTRIERAQNLLEKLHGHPIYI
jgi:hypothetical protein